MFQYNLCKGKIIGLMLSFWFNFLVLYKFLVAKKPQYDAAFVFFV